MGCNCGSGKPSTPTYTHTDTSGKQTVFASKTEAEAYKIRRGGTVKPS